MNRSPLLFLILAGMAGATEGEDESKRMGVEDALALKLLGSVRWMPDGASLVFTIREWLKDDNRYVSHIYRVDRAGGERAQLTRGEKGESSPEISPDGGYLSFTANRDDANQIWLLPLAGGEA